MLVLTTAQMLRVRVQCDPAHMIRPRLLADGNLGVSDGTDLAYLQWGIYRRASELPAAVTTSNMRWGLTDLSDKILNPDPM